MDLISPESRDSCKNESGGGNTDSLAMDKQEASDPYEKLKIVNASVPERVIFCIDRTISPKVIEEYGYVKNNIAASAVEFYVCSPHEGLIAAADWLTSKEPPFLEIPKSTPDNTTDLSVLFEKIAKYFNLPDPAAYSKELPPPFVCHIILIYSNGKLPTIKQPNPFYYLTDNPYVFLDVIYCYRSGRKKRRNVIVEALKGLVDPEKGYFCEGNLMPSLFECLGHPLLRSAQEKSQTC